MLVDYPPSLIDNGLQEISLTGIIAIQSALLRNFHGDPANRMIVATALQSTAKLCTADEKILKWKQSLQRFDARGKQLNLQLESILY